MLPSIISWVVLGLVAGVLGKLIMPGKDPGGCLITILLGIGGSFVGGFLGQKLLKMDMEATGAFNLPSIITATVGAIVLLIIYRLIFGKKK